MSQHFTLAPRGTITAGHVPCCPKCGSITERHGHDARRCTRKDCGAVAPYRFACHGGNSRLWFSVDGSEPMPTQESQRAKLLRGRRYGTIVKRTA